MSAGRNSFIPVPVAETGTSGTLHRLIQPFSIAGMGINEVMVNAAILLIERGETDALRIVQNLLGCTEEIEMRTLLRLRQGLQEAYKGGEP